MGQPQILQLLSSLQVALDEVMSQSSQSRVQNLMNTLLGLIECWEKTGSIVKSPGLPSLQVSDVSTASPVPRSVSSQGSVDNDPATSRMVS